MQSIKHIQFHNHQVPPEGSDNLTYPDRIRLAVGLKALVTAEGGKPAVEATQRYLSSQRLIGNFAALLLLVSLVMLPASHVKAADINLACGDAVSLVSVIDTIKLATNCTYTLTDNIGESGLHIISSEIMIEGNDTTIERDASAPELRSFRVELLTI